MNHGGSRSPWKLFRAGRPIAAALVILLSLTPEAYSGTVGLKPPQSYPVGTVPTALATGDFNHDGNADLAVANAGNPALSDDGNVSILLGNGDGTFQVAMNIAAGKNPGSIAVGDLNEDDNLDIIVTNPGDSTTGLAGGINVLLGKGDGTFQAAKTINSSTFPRHLAMGDLNGDDHLDFVVTQFATGGGKVTVFLGNGDGTFQTPSDVTVGSGASDVLVADFNQDSKLDLIVAVFGGIDVLLGKGDGSFQPPTHLAQGTFTGPLAVADFNGDGKIDLAFRVAPLAIFRPATPVTHVLLGNGDGTFQSAIIVEGGVGSGVGDFDGDGKADLAISKVNAADEVIIDVLLGNGDGTFQSAQSFAAGAIVGAIAVGDFNGDQAPDIAMLQPNTNSIAILMNVGTDFSIAASPATLGSLSRGQSSTSTITLKLVNGFNHPVSLSCSVQPAQSSPTCSLNPTSVMFDANGTATATLTINTAAGVGALSDPHRIFHPFYALALPLSGLAFIGLGFTSKVRNRQLIGALLAGVLLLGVILTFGCGGGGNGGGGTQTYVVTVTGTTAQQTTHNTTVSLTVQ